MLTDEEKRILLQNRLFAELPAERLDGLLQKLSSRTACFGKNSVIWGMGERIDHAGIVLSGRVEAWRYTQDGQESLSAVHEAGGLFGDVLMSARTVGSPVELRTARQSKILFLSLDALLRGGWRKRLHTAAVQSAGGDLGEILGITAPYPPPVHSGRADKAGSVSAAGGGKNRRDRLRRNDARADGPVPWHEPQRPFAPARHDAAGRPLRASPGKPPTPERYRNVNDRSAKAERGRRQLPDDRRHAKADSLTSAFCTCCGRCADTMRTVPHKNVIYLILPDSELPANTGHISRIARRSAFGRRDCAGGLPA